MTLKEKKPKELEQKAPDALEIRATIEEELKLPPPQISFIKLIDTLIVYAYLSRTSDIHIDPGDKGIVVRFRIDGMLHDMFELPKQVQGELVTRIKVLSGLRTDEHQMAQDGRFRAAIPGIGYIDIRVSIAPTYNGENCVMRLLAEQSQDLSLESLGYAENSLKKILRAIEKPYGMILATGPTGSGKTTSMYAVLKKLNTKEVSIITIEDPVEYSLPGVDQIQVNERTGLTFAHGLRFILRQDPNIIMVGEIRDEETANIAVNAAMTGHKLLSTLHANDAATALPRLIDMHVEPFLIASTINVIIGQRLVRTICTKCRIERKFSSAEFNRIKEFFPDSKLVLGAKFYEGKGCDVCGNTGFHGRVGVHEVLEITDTIRELIMKNANSSEIKTAALKEGMTTMLVDGYEKAIAGITTIEEVLRAFHE